MALSAPRQAAEAVEPALVETLAETAKTSKLAVAITRYGGGRRLGKWPPRRLQGSTSTLVEYTIAMRIASAPDVLQAMERVPQGELTQTLKRKITELNLEDEFRTNGGAMNSLTLKQRSINRAPSAGDGPAPSFFGGGNVSAQPEDSAAESGALGSALGSDYAFYASGAGVVLLCMGAMYFTQSSREKQTHVEDISELEEAKPERKPKKKARDPETYELGDAEEEKPRKARRSKSEAARLRPPEEMSDTAAASTTASSDSGRRYSDASSGNTSLPNMPPNRSATRGEAPGQPARRGKTEGSRAVAVQPAPPQSRYTSEVVGPPQRRYTTDLDARRAQDPRALRRSATGTHQPHLDGRAPRQSERASRPRP